MKTRLRILFLSSEVAPFAKTGGLADVCSALPKALFEKGHDVRVMMPKYGTIGERKYTLREVIRLKEIPVKMGDKIYPTNAKSAFIPDSKVQIYFLDYKPFFDRPDLYVDSKTGKDYPDNAERFALFCRAVLETIKILHWEPQVIHCNDWQTALIPWLLRNEYKDDSFFNKTRTMLSIHNVAYQGVFDPDVLPRIGIPESEKEPGSDLEFYGKINFLKGGIKTADVITTVSPTYANEIQSDPELGCGLQDVLKERSQDLHGILNGVDYSVWDPEKDKLIPARYSAADLSGKLTDKQALLDQCGLPFDESIPVIGMVSRLVDQKGFDLLADSVDDIIKLKTQLVILGVGDPKYHKLLEKLAKKYPKNISVNLRYDNELAHLIEAGSDMLLMPSKYEPCGLNQMYSLKYGTVPIVRKTGGLADTIIDFIADPANGNGFVFESYDSKALVQAIKNAVETFRQPKVWQKLMKKGMKQNFGWQVAADKYIKLYAKLDNTKRKK